MSEGKTEKLLEEASIKYIIVPFDSENEIFLTDRKYDNKLYLETVNQIKVIKWLKQIGEFGKIVVFEKADYKNHFWSLNQNLKINYRYINPTEYEVDIENAKKGDVLVFSESYDKNWQAISSSKFRVQSSKFNNKFNSFVLSADGNYSLKVYYSLQDYVGIGLVISVVALVISISSLLLE